MERRPHREIQDIYEQLKSAENELDELQHQLRAFEAVVDAQLGHLLDQLSDLNEETSALEAELRHIRDERLYGRDMMSYQMGAPQPKPPPKLSDIDPRGISHREAIHAKADSTPSGVEIPDIKVLYRKLARRYHPDLARSAADRSVSNSQMAEINQAYQEGDLKTLIRLAGIVLPYGWQLPKVGHDQQRQSSINEAEQARRKLDSIRQQIARMSSLAIVRLSLDVKLAQHQGRNLLREMAGELQFKVERKRAHRDYLRAQIKSNSVT